MNNKQKIDKVVILGTAYPYRGGTAIVVGYIYHLLTSKGIEVGVYNFKRLYPKLLFPGKHQEDISKKPIKPHPSYRTIDSIGPLTWFKTAKAILNFKPSLILVNWYQPFFALAYNGILSIIKKKSSIPVVILTHNIISHEARFIDTFLTKMVFRWADGFITFSKAVANRLKELYPNHPIINTYLPLHIEEIENHWTYESAKKHLGLENYKVILFFGVVRHYKGLDVLIKAFKILADNRQDVFLLIVGESYENPNKYKRMMKMLGIEHRIKWIEEYVPNEEVPLYYTAADVVVLPYRSGTQSGVQHIAFAFEKPIVVTRVGGISEEIEAFGAGEIVPPQEPQKLAQAIEKVISNPYPYILGSRNAKNTIKFDVFWDNLKKLYEEIKKPI